jgi:predicted nucleic acid-binding Zn ribbon protein
VPWYCFVCTECEHRHEVNQLRTNEYCTECQAFMRRDYRAENAAVAIQNLKTEREGR